MGVDTPIPPIIIDPAAPDGAPPRRINTVDFSEIFLPERLKENRTAPPCLEEALIRGTIVIFTFFCRFSWFGCERPFMSVSTKPKNYFLIFFCSCFTIRAWIPK
jgi:hypothetical protein